MKPELRPGCGVRKAGNPESAGSISIAMRRSASEPTSHTAIARMSAANATGSAWKLPPDSASRIRLDSAGAHQRQEIGRIINHYVDLPRKQVLHRRGCTAIRHKLIPRSRLFLEEDAGKMRRASYASGGLRRLVRVRLQPSDEFLQVICRHLVLCNDQLGVARDQRNGFEICKHIVLERVDSTIHYVSAPMTDTDCVAIGRRARDA